MIIWVVVFLLLIFGINTVPSLYIPTVPVTLDVASSLPDLIFSQDLKTVHQGGSGKDLDFQCLPCPCPTFWGLLAAPLVTGSGRRNSGSPGKEEQAGPMW